MTKLHFWSKKLILKIQLSTGRNTAVCLHHVTYFSCLFTISAVCLHFVTFSCLLTFSIQSSAVYLPDQLFLYILLRILTVFTFSIIISAVYLHDQLFVYISLLLAVYLHFQYKLQLFVYILLQISAVCLQFNLVFRISAVSVYFQLKIKLFVSIFVRTDSVLSFWTNYDFLSQCVHVIIRNYVLTLVAWLLAEGR